MIKFLSGFIGEEEVLIDKSFHKKKEDKDKNLVLEI